MAAYTVRKRGSAAVSKFREKVTSLVSMWLAAACASLIPAAAAFRLLQLFPWLTFLVFASGIGHWVLARQLLADSAVLSSGRLW